MATFFGEIRPLSSRAIDDDEALDNPPKNVIYSESPVEKEKFDYSNKLIIFSVGDIASIFVESHFVKDVSDAICIVKYPRKPNYDDSTFYTMLSYRNVEDISAVRVYSVSSDVLVCVSKKSIPEEYCNDIAEHIFQKFSPSQMLILTTAHMATFKAEGPVSYERPFLKKLSTSHYTKVHSSNISALNSPNFLSNLPASLLLKCEITNLPAMCVINYVDTDAIDALNVEVFNDVFKEAIVSHVSRNSDAKSRVIENIKNRQLTESNLYT